MKKKTTTDKQTKSKRVKMVHLKIMDGPVD